MRSVDLLKGTLIGLDLIFGAFSLTLMIICLWNLSSNHGLIFLMPRGLLFGGLILGPLGIFSSWMASRGTSGAFSVDGPGPTIFPEELIKNCREATQNLITSLMLCVLTVAFSSALFAFAQVQTLDMDWVWDNSSSVDLFRIQEWGKCCGFARIDDRVQLPCKSGNVGCRGAMDGLWKRVGRTLETPSLGIMIAGSLVLISLTALLVHCKRKERAERRRIRRQHQQQSEGQDDDGLFKKSLFQ